MANANSATRFLRRVRTRPAQVRARPADFSDFADFGTAFGLDLSLQPEAGPALPATPAARGHAWWRRLGARRNVPR
jgi:hypothetical protein